MNINVIYLHTFCCMYIMFNRAFEDKTIKIDLYILVCFKMIKTILKSCDEKGCENDLDILRLKITSCFYNLSRMYCKTSKSEYIFIIINSCPNPVANNKES